jgi:predicted amidohydrolase YtcJ
MLSALPKTKDIINIRSKWMKHWKNARIHTLDDNKVYEEMVTKNGEIVHLGPNFPHQVHEIIDLKGNHVYPGFVDFHMHLLGYGHKLLTPNLNNLKDKDAVTKKIKSFFNQAPLFVEGYFDVGLNASDLDKISNQHPICLRHNDYHSVTVNSVILNQIHLQQSNGMLTEENAERAMDAFPSYTSDDLERMLSASMTSLYQYGITGAHSDDLAYFNGFHETYRVFENVLKEKPFRAHLLVHHHVLDDWMNSKHPFLDQNEFLQLGAVKIFYDGTISSKTALFFEPYQDSQQNGLRIFKQEALEALMVKVRKYQRPVAIHVIGDRGLDEVADLLLKYPVKEGLHDRIIHASFANEKTLKKLQKLPLVFDIQPQFLSSDLPWAYQYMSKKPQFVYPFKTYLDNNLVLLGSSDAPVEIPNPLLGIRALAYRISDHDHQVYQEEEKISLRKAIELYTIHSDIATYHSNRGKIKLGYIADFSIFKQDLEMASQEDLQKDLVYMTVVNEEIVYKNDKT